MQKVIIYTDGACSGNPGMGGFGTILMCRDKTKELRGSLAETTNNQMELIGVIEGLQALNQPCEVEVYSDSAYVVNAFVNGWLNQWKNNGWTGSNKKTIANRALWEQLDILTSVHKVVFYKVKGHADDKYNNRCDELARLAITELKRDGKNG